MAWWKYTKPELNKSTYQRNTLHSLFTKDGLKFDEQHLKLRLLIILKSLPHKRKPLRKTRDKSIC